MRRLRAALHRFAGLFLRARRSRAFDEELESVLQLHVDDNLRAGMPPETARARARLALGGVEQTRHAWRERASVPIVEHLAMDVRFAIRQLAGAPGFTLTAILTLALGIGASVAIFGFVDAALIRPLPYPEPNRLVDVTESTPQIPRAALSWLDYLDWKAQNTVFESLDVYGGRNHMLATPTGTQSAIGARVSAGFFRTLGVRPLLGRDFYSGEDRANVARSAILSYGTWQARYGGRADIVGQTVTLDSAPHTIVGVLPQEFRFAPRGRAEFWTPFQIFGPCELRRSCHNLSGVGRLRPGVTVEAALAEMTAIARRLEAQYPESNRGQGATIRPLAELVTGEVRPVLLALFGGASLLLVIACVNVTSLLLVRSEARRRELSMRSALGASRGRLLRQFIAEAAVLVTLASVAGLVLASLGMQGLSRLIPADMQPSMPFLPDLGINTHTVLAALTIATVTSVVFALIPAVRTSFDDMREGLSEGGRGAAGNTWGRLGYKLVVLELATAMVLLVGAGLLGKSLYKLLTVDLGFEAERLATLQVGAPRATYDTNQRAVTLAADVERRLRALPGVESVGIASLLPVSGNGNTDWIRFVGRPWNGQHTEVNQRDISVGYFPTLRARLIRGRFFTDADTATSRKVTIINQTLARQYFPNQDPIGKQFGDRSLTPDSIKEIVGVVDDVRESSLDMTTWPSAYYPFTQSAFPAFALVARSTLPEEMLFPSLRAALRDVDPNIAVSATMTMTTRINDSRVAWLRRSAAWVVGGFAALALLSGMIGLYGVVAYSVSQRTREIGVRLAMGAEPRTVYGLVLREGGRLALMGLTLGLVCSVGAATLLRRLLFGTPPWDLATLLAVSALLGLAALIASVVPARRAAAVNPIEALRAE
jgi:macrolide transport system ATP-binding/permease protein